MQGNPLCLRQKWREQVCSKLTALELLDNQPIERATSSEEIDLDSSSTGSAANSKDADAQQDSTQLQEASTDVTFCFEVESLIDRQ